MNKLKLQRLKREITQYDLSRVTGITQSRISLFENGLIKLRAAELERVRLALNGQARREAYHTIKPKVKIIKGEVDATKSI